MKPTLTLFTALLLAPLAAVHAADAPAKEATGTFQGLPPEIDAALSKGWITLLDKEQPNVQHTALRRHYTLPKEPGRVVGYVTAGTLYRLYVNGRLAMFGPAPATKGRRFVDEVDLADYVLPGDNSVAIEWLYSPFRDGSEFPEHNPGVGFCLTSDAKVIEPPDQPWRYRWFRAHDQGAESIDGSRQDLNEIMNLSKVERGWAAPGFDDRSWEVVPPRQASATPIFSPRPVPLPALALIPAAQVAESGLVRLPSKTGGHAVKNDATLSAAKFLQAGQFVPGGDALRPWNAKTAGEVLLPGSDEGSPYALFDLGQPVMGNMELDVTIPTGVRLDCFFIQALNRFSGQPWRSNSGTFRVSLLGDGRRANFAAFHNSSGRYLCLVARGLAGGQKVQIDGVGVRERSALPSGTRSAFMQCSDRELNRLLAESLRAMRLCTVDFPIDGMPDEMKMYVEYCSRPGYPAYHVFYGQHPGFVSAVLDMLPEAQNPPWMAGAVRRLTFIQMGIDSFFSFVHDVYDLHRYHGTPVSPKHIERMKLTVEVLDRSTNSEGLLQNIETPLDISRTARLDTLYSPGSGGLLQIDKIKQDFMPVGANALYYKTLGLLFEMTGDPAYTLRKEALKAGLLKMCLPYVRSAQGSRLNRFVPDAFVRNDKGWEPFSVSGATQMFGVNTVWRSETEQNRLLNSGVLDQPDADRLWEVLAPWRPYRFTTKDDVKLFNIPRAGVYGLYERYEYLTKLKRGDILLTELKEAFEQFRDLTLTQWNAEDAREMGGGGIENSMYATLIFECVTGIKPGPQGGYALCLIEPLLDETLTWARGTKETEQGSIGVNWSRGEFEFLLTVTLPKGVEAEVVLPSQAMTIALRGGHAVAAGGRYTIKKPTTFRITQQQGVVLQP